MKVMFGSENSQTARLRLETNIHMQDNQVLYPVVSESHRWTNMDDAALFCTASLTFL